MKKITVSLLLFFLGFNLSFAQLNWSYKKFIRYYDFSKAQDILPSGFNEKMYLHKVEMRAFTELIILVDTYTGRIKSITYKFPKKYESEISDYCQKTGYLTDRFGYFSGNRLYYATTTHSVKFQFYDLKNVDEGKYAVTEMLLQFDLVDSRYKFNTGLNEWR